jgi:hypothetical protein
MMKPLTPLIAISFTFLAACAQDRTVVKYVPAPSKVYVEQHHATSPVPNPPNLAPQEKKTTAKAHLETGNVRVYKVVYKNFSTTEVFRLSDLLEKNMPGFLRSGEPRGSTSNLSMSYTVKASSKQVFRAVNTSLQQAGFNPDSQIKVIHTGNMFVVDKIFG